MVAAFLHKNSRLAVHECGSLILAASGSDGTEMIDLGNG